jgi:hypothetical protein
MGMRKQPARLSLPDGDLFRDPALRMMPQLDPISIPYLSIVRPAGGIQINLLLFQTTVRQTGSITEIDSYQLVESPKYIREGDGWRSGSSYVCCVNSQIYNGPINSQQSSLDSFRQFLPKKISPANPPWISAPRLEIESIVETLLGSFRLRQICFETPQEELRNCLATSG